MSVCQNMGFVAATENASLAVVLTVAKTICNYQVDVISRRSYCNKVWFGFR